jgi:ribosomal protein L4
VQVPVYNVGGEVVKNIEISDSVFGVPFNEALVHQAMVKQRADARQGTSEYGAAVRRSLRKSIPVKLEPETADLLREGTAA